MNEIMSGLEIGTPIIWGEMRRVVVVTSEQVNRYANFLIYFIGITLTIFIVVLLMFITVLIKSGVVTNWDSLEEFLKESDKKSNK